MLCSVRVNVIGNVMCTNEGLYSECPMTVYVLDTNWTDDNQRHRIFESTIQV